MPSNNRRQAINDSSIATRGISARSFNRFDYGTHAMGGGAGTITFKHGAFQGTPVVILQPIAGFTLSGGGTAAFVQVRSRFSGSFTYFGTPRHGTFQWLAVGSYV